MYSMRRIRRFFGAFLLVCALPATAMAEPLINKTYSYFRIGGRTAEELDRELEKNGPLTHTTGHRHPGVTEIKFGGDVTYVEKGGECAVGGTRVTLRTHITLPRWSNRGKASSDLGFIWDTLSADIKRHEERHAEIARNHARQLERELQALRPSATCDALERRVADLTRRLLESHDSEQLRFDQVEAANFDARMTRLLQYNIQRKRR
jgi:predicted secreted Zn-dependent protease